MTAPSAVLSVEIAAWECMFYQFRFGSFAAGAATVICPSRGGGDWMLPEHYFN